MVQFEKGTLGGLKLRGSYPVKKAISIFLVILRLLLPFIRKGYKFYESKKAMFRAALAFFTENGISGVCPNLVIDYSKFTVTAGTLQPIISAVAATGQMEITFTWIDNSGTNNAQPDDMAIPIIFDKVRNEAIYRVGGETRADGTTTLFLPYHWAGDQVAVYLGFVSKDGRKIANSVYLGEKVVA